MEGVWPSAPPSDKTHNIKDIKAIIDLKESLMSLISLRPERLRVQAGTAYWPEGLSFYSPAASLARVVKGP